MISTDTVKSEFMLNLLDSVVNGRSIYFAAVSRSYFYLRLTYNPDNSSIVMFSEFLVLYVFISE